MWHKKTRVFPRLFLTFIILILSLLTLTVFGSASYEETSGVPNTEETTTPSTEETTSPDNETNDNNNEKCYHLAIKWLEKASEFATFPAQEPGKTALG